MLRDSDGDGTYERQTVFADNLNAPYGLALVGSQLYVANQDALVRFDYQDGQTEASGPPVKVTDLPSAINHHWTKAMAASADGRFLYVGIGSNSNITERGMDGRDRPGMVWQVDAQTGRAQAVTLPGCAIPPHSLSSRERPALGGRERARRDRPNLVPDYLTSVREGGFYGWPYSYWGQNVDTRVRPQDPQKVASAIRPDYSLGSHVAALGVAFSSAGMGADFADGVFVGEHGSWNRSMPVGYKVVFVPFRDGRPAGPPVDFVSGFHGERRQDPRAAGRSERRSARRTDRCRRPFEHDLASHSIASTRPPGNAPEEGWGGEKERLPGPDARSVSEKGRKSESRRSPQERPGLRAGAHQDATAQAQMTAPIVSTP